MSLAVGGRRRRISIVNRNKQPAPAATEDDDEKDVETTDDVPAKSTETAQQANPFVGQRSMKPLVSTTERRVAAASVPSYTRIDGIKASMKRISSVLAKQGIGAFTQDPFVIIKGIHDSGLWSRLGIEGSVSTARDLEGKLNGYYLQFLTNGMKVAELRKTVTAASQAVAENLERVYHLESTKSIGTSSVNAPVLRFARVFDDNVRSVLDWNHRVVVKEYAKFNEVVGAPAKNGSTIADMATDIIIGGTVINQFVTHFRDVVTPHFAYQPDWFIGPSIADGDAGVTKDTFKGHIVHFNPKRLSQFVIVERIDTTFVDFIKVPPLGKVPASQIVPTLLNIRALLAEALYSLDVWWQTRRGLHQDMHLGNLMVRGLEQEPNSPYTGKSFVYSRAGMPHMVIKATDHENLFLEIIDFGRSRSYIPVSNEIGEKTLVLFGDNAFAENGINVAPELIDRSWDMRRMGYQLLTDLDVNVLLKNTLAKGVPSGEADALLRKFKQWIAVASNIGHLILVIAELLDTLIDNTPSLETKPSVTQETVKEDRKTVKTAVKPLVDRCKAIIASGRLAIPGVGKSAKRLIKKLKDENRELLYTYTSDEAAAVALYDEIAPLLQGLPADKPLASSAWASSTKMTVNFDILFNSLFADASELASGHHGALHAEYCLYETPFFADLLVSEKSPPVLSENIIQAGILHADDVIPKDLVDTGVIVLSSEKPLQPVDQSPRPIKKTVSDRGKRPLLRRGQNPLDDNVSEFSKTCTHCGEVATGVLFSNTGVPVEAFCSESCALLYI